MTHQSHRCIQTWRASFAMTASRAAVGRRFWTNGLCGDLLRATSVGHAPRLRLAAFGKWTPLVIDAGRALVADVIAHGVGRRSVSVQGPGIHPPSLEQGCPMVAKHGSPYMLFGALRHPPTCIHRFPMFQNVLLWTHRVSSSSLSQLQAPPRANYFQHLPKGFSAMDSRSEAKPKVESNPDFANGGPGKSPHPLLHTESPSYRTSGSRRSQGGPRLRCGLSPVVSAGLGPPPQVHQPGDG